MTRSQAPHSKDKKASGLKLTNKQIALYGVLIGLALVFGYVEAMIPLPFTVPGVKLGLGNIVVLLSMLSLGAAPACFIMCIKVVATSFLFGNPSIFIYSLVGALLAYIAMLLLIKFTKISIISVSVIGAICHNLGQLIVVGIVFNYLVVLSALPILLISGLITGLITGQICLMALRAFPDKEEEV